MASLALQSMGSLPIHPVLNNTSKHAPAHQYYNHLHWTCGRQFTFLWVLKHAQVCCHSCFALVCHCCSSCEGCVTKAI